MEMYRQSSIERVLKQLEKEQWHETYQDLFRFFCMNVHLGQWELARTAIVPLLENTGNKLQNANSHDSSIVNIPEMLYMMCQNPFNQSLGSKTVPTDHHLSWLCLQELMQSCSAFCAKEEESINKLKKDNDLRLLLMRIPDVDSSIIKELYVFFYKHVLGKTLKWKKIHEFHPDFLTTAALDALKSVILTDPCLGNSIIRAMMTDSEASESKNELLQGIFIKCMNQLLDQIEDEKGPDYRDIQQDNAMIGDKVLEILSFYDPLPYWNYLDLRQLLFRLVRLAVQDRSGWEHFTVESIVSVLCGRSSSYLSDEFSKLYFEVSAQVSTQESSTDLKVLREHQSQNFHLLSSMNRNKCWRDFYISCQKRHVHFLGEVLDLSLALVKAEKFMELQDVLSFPDLQPLKPTVLLMGWSYCHSSTHARTLLETLWDDNVEGFNEMFVKICRKLAYHLDFMQWCLERTRPLLGDSEVNVNIHATQLLKGLDTHSVLHMLHYSTSLASLDHKEVLQLLNNVSADKKTDDKRKSVSFEDDDSPTPPEELVNVEQERDVVVFRSYCALKNVMDAILFGVENCNHILMNPVHNKRMIHYKSLSRRFRSEKSISSSEGEESSSPIFDAASTGNSVQESYEEDKEGFEEFSNSYQESVVSKFNEARNHLAHLQPLNYRLEILENIFSLLFLSHEDFCEESGLFEVDSDPEEEDSKLASGEKLNPESLNLSIVSEEDFPIEDSGLEKSKLSPKNSDKSSTPLSIIPKNVSRPSHIDYDEPFVEKGPHSAQFSTSNLSKGNDAKSTTRRKINFFLHSVQSKPIGFLLNEYLVRDVIHLLKESISDLNEARYSFEKSSKDKVKKSPAFKVKKSLEKALRGHVLTSVKEETFAKRLMRLTQLVNEAWWRFQLIAPTEISKEPNSVLPKPVHVLDHDVSFVTLSSSSIESPDSDDQRKRSETGSPPPPPIQGMLPHQSSIVSRLMASPESLLVFCLVKDNPTQAAQVMKLFKLTENTPETMEFNFMNVYQESASHIWNLDTEPKETGGGPVKLGKRSVKALCKAAAVGIATASLSQIVEEVIASSSLPPLSRPKSINFREYYPFLFSMTSSSAVLFDLLCSSCRTWETCKNMIDLIKTQTNISEHELAPESPTSPVSQFRTASLDLRSHSSKSSKSTKRRQHLVVGCSEVFKNLHALIHYGEEQEQQEPWHRSSSVSSEQILSTKFGLQHHFHSGYSSFKVSKLHSLEVALDELSKAVGKSFQTLSGSHLDSSAHSDDFAYQTPPRSSVSGAFFPRKTNLQDQSPIHFAFKELMFAMEKYVPGDGLAQILLREGKSNMAPMRNFLFSLYEHVREMANLIVECEGNNQALIMNYFKTLGDGPISILGRLMFVRKLSPHRLEAVAKKLSLNLTHTIVHSCCPKIPSKRFPPLIDESNAQFVLHNSHRVFNVTDEELRAQTLKAPPELGKEQEASLDPEQTVRNILSALIQEMQDIAHDQNPKGVFDITCAKALIGSLKYEEIRISARKLRHLDLRLLDSSDQLLCFFANLANLMVIQCHLSHIQEHVQLANNAAEGTFEDQQNMCPDTALDFVAYFNSFSYQVGQLGIISTFDVLTHLGRASFSSQPKQWNGLLSFAKLVLADEDPWKIFKPPKNNLLFVINMGCISSPPLQVLRPQTLKTQLDSCMKNYLSHSVTVKKEKEWVSIPELLVWHENDFVEESAEGSKYTALVKWLSNHVDVTIQQGLQYLFSLDSLHGYSENIDLTGRIELPFQVDVDRFDSRFSVTFDVSNVQVGTSTMEAPRINLVTAGGRPRRMTVSLELSGQSLGLELPTYNLTPKTLEYVKHDSRLVATMVSLVCADNLDNIEETFTDDHFKAQESISYGSHSSKHLSESFSRMSRSSSDISIVDIRSYRYQRLTEDYPILQRHILHYILPLAAADNPDLMECHEPILKFVTNVIDEQVKLCMFSLPGSDQYLCVILDMATRLLEERKWIQILNILKTLPESTILHSVKLQSLHDFSLMCYALDQVQKPGQGPKVGNVLRTFYNPTLQARTLLSLSYRLPIDLAIDLLDHSMAAIDLGSGLWKALRARYDKILIFSKAINCIKELRIKLYAKNLSLTCQSYEEQEFLKSLEEFTDWRYLTDASVDISCQVIEILKRAGNFQLAEEWAKLFRLPMEIFKEIAQSHLLHLLQQEHPVTVQAFQLLDELCKSSETECLSICQSLVSGLTSPQESRPQEVKFVLSFIMECLTHLMSHEDVDDVRLQRIGAEALVHIPVNIRGEYNHLITCPSLILEQLLMNMKADLAGQIFGKIKSDFFEIQEPKLKMTQENFNNLLSYYSRKAIEVNVVQVKDCSLTESMASVDSGPNEDSELTVSTAKGVAGDQKKVEMAGSPSASIYSSQHDNNTKEGLKANNYKILTIPTQPLPQDQWVPDDAAARCMVCKMERFSMFSRRHHCRVCGRVVCSTCSVKSVNISGLMHRSCDECFSQIKLLSQLKDQEEAEIYGQHIRENLSTAGNENTFTGGASPGPADLWKIRPKLLKLRMAEAVHHEDHSWKLRPDTTHNEQVRSEFYYEQAPSVSLCISVLKQHISRLDAGKMILSLCDTLSAHLVPISPGVPNPEIDYSLIISMMKQLLFQAKLDFLHTSNTSMIGQCDMYLTHVDLLRIMVESNYQDLPTIRELTKQDSVRRLRDKLIADERLPLAMEVSTKCGIDPMGVWSAMGFTCLHMGDFEGARDKFGHCLKRPVDKNQTSSSQSRLLVEIINCLDRIPSSGVTEVQMLLRNPKGICDISTLMVPSVGEENRVDSVPYKECLFYLRTYGSYTDHINFLRQHGYWMKAVQFAMDYHCSSEVFITGLVKPALNSGDLGRLLEQMLMLDPTLEKWALYLSSSCRFFLKNKYFYTLYHVQLFMKDFIRAAMTCISYFYQRGARTYLDLCGRMPYLFTAQQHLQAYLDPSQWGSVPHPLNPKTPPVSHGARPSAHWGAHPEAAARLTLAVEEVKSHIRKVALQIEITKFLEQCLTQAISEEAEGRQVTFPASPQTQSSGKNPPPTLFGQTAQRAELIILLFLSGNDFKASMNLVMRMIKECHLTTASLYHQCARELAKRSRFKEIELFIKALFAEGLIDDNSSDEILGDCVLLTYTQEKDGCDSLIQLIKNKRNKINSLIICGKLRTAYLLAIEIGSVQSVKLIRSAAEKEDQSSVLNICNTWLKAHQKDNAGGFA